VGVQVIGIIGAGGIFTLAGARCSEVKKEEEEERERKKREKGRRGDPRKEKVLRYLVRIFLQRV
jgi:hypothetical protein